MAPTHRGPVLTVGELRRMLDGLPERAPVALSTGDSPDAAGADLRTLFVDVLRDTIVVFRPPEQKTVLLFEAVEQDDLSLVQRLVDEGADVDARAPSWPLSDGATSLTYAADGGQVAMTSLLLKLGASVDARSASGWTALMRACNAGQIETARVLLEAGADATLVNDEGYTAGGRIPGNHRELLDFLAQWEATHGRRGTI